MKKFITLSVFVFITTIFLASCVKESHSGNSQNYWLSKEKGEVVYSDSYCNYYVVESYYGYTVIRSSGGYKPYEGSIVYGDFGYRGTREFYNRSSGFTFFGTVTDYWLSYNQAQDALDYYCPIYGKNGNAPEKRVFKESTIIKKK